MDPKPARRGKRRRPPSKPIKKPETEADKEDMMSLYSVSTSNSFSALESEDGDSLIKKPRSTKPKPPPAIVIYNGGNLTQAQINQSISSCGITMGNISRRLTVEGTKLFTATPEDFKKVRSKLVDLKVQFHTYTLQEDRITRFVLYGLPSGIDIELVQQSISAQTTKDPVDIKTFALKKQRYAEEAIYMVYFKKSQDVTLDMLKQITGIEGYRVSFNHYRKKEGPTQCMNCARYGHSFRNCNLPSRCTRCSGQHASRSCPLIIAETNKIPDDKLKCVNCEGAHASTSGDCPKRRIIIESRRAASAERRRRMEQRRQYNGEFQHDFPHMRNKKGPIHNEQPSIETASYIRAMNSNPTECKFSPTQLFNIFIEISEICIKQHTKLEQIKALSAVVSKYIINEP